MSPLTAMLFADGLGTKGFCIACDAPLKKRPAGRTGRQQTVTCMEPECVRVLVELRRKKTAELARLSIERTMRRALNAARRAHATLAAPSARALDVLNLSASGGGSR